MTPPPAGAPSPAAEAVLPEQAVLRLLVLLSAAAGCLDAVCVSRLGGLFASVVTGDLVQLGLAMATLDGRLAVGATAAVGGYALGVAAGTAALPRGQTGWGRRTTLVAAAELLLLACLAASWPATDAHPGPTTAPLLLAPAGVAMGVQSIVTISSGVPGAATTYLTGTFTNAVRALAGHPHRDSPVVGSAGRLVALLCGAAAGALALRVAPLSAPAVSVTLVGVVVAAAALGLRRRGTR